MAYTIEAHQAAHRAVLAAVREALRVNFVPMSDHGREELAESIVWQLLDRGAVEALAEAGWSSLVTVKPWLRDMVHIPDDGEDK
jgi:hypothetical protein